MNSAIKTLIILFTLVVASFSGPSFASVTIEGVTVQAAADDPTQAKEKALSKGEIEAFQKVLSATNPALSVKDFSPARISATIDSYDIQNESITANAYKAVVDYNFDQAKVDALIKNQPQGSPGYYKSGSGSAISNEILVLVPIQGLNGWIKIKRDIASTTGVSGIGVVAFSLTQVDATVKFSGSPNTLAEALQNKGYSVSQEQGYWIVRR